MTYRNNDNNYIEDDFAVLDFNEDEEQPWNAGIPIAYEEDFPGDTDAYPGDEPEDAVEYLDDEPEEAEEYLGDEPEDAVEYQGDEPEEAEEYLDDEPEEAEEYPDDEPEEADGQFDLWREGERDDLRILFDDEPEFPEGIELIDPDEAALNGEMDNVQTDARLFEVAAEIQANLQQSVRMYEEAAAAEYADVNSRIPEDGEFFDEDDEYFDNDVPDTTQIISGKDAGKAPVKSFSQEEIEEADADHDEKAKKQEAKQIKRDIRQAESEKKQREKAEKKAAKLHKKEQAKIARGGRPHPAVFWVPGVIVFLLAAVYIAGTVYFTKHFGFSSVINDTACDYWTVSQVEDMISEQTKDYKLRIVERDDKSETLSAADVGLVYVPDGQVEQLLKDQKAYAWPVRAFKHFTDPKELESAQTHASVKLDDEKLKEAIGKLEATDEEAMKAPKNAKVILDGALYAVEPEYLGTTIADLDDMTEKIRTAMLSTCDTFDMEAEACYTYPEVYSDDEKLIKKRDRYNEYASLTITYHLHGDDTMVLDGATTSEWLTWGDKLEDEPEINEDAIREYCTGLGKTYDTVGSTRTFIGGDGQEHQVSGGTFGWSVDEATEFTLIKQMFEEKKSQDRDITWLHKGESLGDSDFGDSFLEVNIATQHMYMVKDGKVVFENDVVTGIPDGKHDTPQGVYSVLEMRQGKVLRGDRRSDGSYEYETPVDYWLRVTWTGVGFHDATWQPAFGGNRYTWAGSHGCINMSYSGVQELYGLAWEGMPVVIHH